MRDAAADLDFEEAARMRDEIRRLQARELEIADDPLALECERADPCDENDHAGEDPQSIESRRRGCLPSWAVT